MKDFFTLCLIEYETRHHPDKICTDPCVRFVVDVVETFRIGVQMAWASRQMKRNQY
jgi:hypothetical protein